MISTGAAAAIGASSLVGGVLLGTGPLSKKCKKPNCKVCPVCQDCPKYDFPLLNSQIRLEAGDELSSGGSSIKCFADSDANSLVCGPGTRREGNECVVDQPTVQAAVEQLECGKGTKREGNECVINFGYPPIILEEERKVFPPKRDANGQMPVIPPNMWVHSNSTHVNGDLSTFDQLPKKYSCRTTIEERPSDFGTDMAGIMMRKFNIERPGSDIPAGLYACFYHGSRNMTDEMLKDAPTAQLFALDHHASVYNNCLFGNKFMPRDSHYDYVRNKPQFASWK